MQKNNRRVFMMQVAAGASAMALGLKASQAAEKLTENDAYAKSMGFKYDTKTVDNKRWTRHKPDQACNSCQLWDGKQADAFAPCSFFGDRLTPNAGWCKNWKIRKA
jgi:hypothetical protein